MFIHPIEPYRAMLVWVREHPLQFLFMYVKNFYISINWVIVHYFSKMEALLDIKMEATLEATKMEVLNRFPHHS